MEKQLSCSIGQYSHQGKKESNQDFHGVLVPDEPALSTKGITLAIADGISSSQVSHVASQTSVKSFLEDYYCTSETWTVKSSARRVLLANNSWLLAQNQRHYEYRLDKDKGYVCTFSALILRSNTAYIFHVGDAQLSRLRNTDVGEPISNNKSSDVINAQIDVLTEPHRVYFSETKSYLARALGITQQLDIDYSEQRLEVGDIFVLATDGVYEYVSNEWVFEIIDSNMGDLDLAAQKIIEEAIERGSDDNLTIQIVRVESLPFGKPSEFIQRLNDLPFPSDLQARATFDGYRVVRQLHRSSRSCVLLAQDLDTNENVVIKLPSTEGRQDSDYVERFLMEEWIANRLNNPHVVKSYKATRVRQFCYVVTEFIEGKTLAQWMVDNPTPSLDEVRSIVEQIAIGLQAFHRQEMIHQDLRPNNIMIDSSGTVKIIDFGSTFVFGLAETQTQTLFNPQTMPGTAQFIAPEYFLGEFGSKQSDLYSLACITYYMLCGRAPYRTPVARALTRAEQKRLVYQSIQSDHRALPAWVDLSLKKALQADPRKRYLELSEFVHDLRKPNSVFANQLNPPLLERNPLLFWQGVTVILSIVIIGLLL